MISEESAVTALKSGASDSTLPFAKDTKDLDEEQDLYFSPPEKGKNKVSVHSTPKVGLFRTIG